MCNDFGNHIPYSDYQAAFSQTRIPVKWPSAAPNLEPREDIGRLIRPPSFAGWKTRRMSLRSHAGAFRRSGQRVRPSSISAPRDAGSRSGDASCRRRISLNSPAPSRPKTKWKFTKAGEDWFCFAGLWRPMPQGGEAFTLLTTDPGPDVVPIHDLRW